MADSIDRRWSAALRRVLPAVVGLVLFSIALWLVRRQLAQHSYAELVREARAIAPARVLIAIALTCASYFTLTFYDALAIRHVGATLGRARVVLTSFIAYVASANLGLSWFGGGAVRYRLYTAFGLSAVEVTTITLFVGATSWLGLATLAGTALLASPGELASSLSLPPLALRAVGAVALLSVVVYVAACALRQRPWSIRGFELRLPGVRTALAQIGLSCLDWSLASLVLYALLPAASSVSPARWIETFAGASALALLSHVPGGIGVFDMVMLKSFGDDLGVPQVAGALLVYRGVYYLLPLGAGAAAFGGFEIAARRAALARIARAFEPMFATIVPSVLALIVFVAGALLLLSGATPPIAERHAWLREFAPLAAVETSHLAASIVGVALLAIADAVRRRVDAAFHLLIALLAAGIIASLAKGVDWEEALLLATLLAALLPAHRYFDRRAAILHGDFDPLWWTALIAVVGASALLVHFAHASPDWSSETWWRFEIDAHAPRSMRATLAVAITAVGFVVLRALRPTAPREADRPGEAETIDALVRASPATYAQLAWTGDKRCLLSESGDAFVMYAVVGRSWVAMGDAIGSEAGRRDVTWTFVEDAHRFGGRPVFYQVAPGALPLYAELGLTLLKLGEEAQVDLREFDLEGRARKGLRHSVNKVEKEGFEFEIAEFGSPRAPEAALRAVSDAWLEEKRTREKRFSVGRFDTAYLARTKIALVRRGDEIVAFANLWLGAGRAELSVDLMRSSPAAPSGTMDYLFAKVMLWGREQGFARFNLGIAPLAGIEVRGGAPAWHRLAALVYRFGEHFYNFEGLRDFKQKFDPQWESRYLASPGGLALPAVLRDVTTLVAGGARGVLAK